MFDKIGRFSAKYRYAIIAFWLVLVVVVLLFAPSLADVVTSDQASYLPEGEASVVAAKLAAEYFPDQASPSQAVLVIQSDQGSIHDPEVKEYLASLTGWLENELPTDVVGTVLSPADPNLANRLISEDGKVAMIFVGLRGATEDPDTVAALDEMQIRLEAAPEGLQGYVTGSVSIINDYIDGVMESADRTTIITIVLVIVILLIIYRSPVSPIIPLATIGIAFLVSRGLVALLGQYGLVVSSITEVVMVVLLFGAGTDYCLFLVSRFREHMADDLPAVEGAQRTVSRVGETITSSAGTVIIGMIALSFAEMGMFASTGPSLALGVAIALLAGLTLTPAMLALLGKWAFWPGGAKHAERGGFWGKLAHWVTGRPWIPLVLGLVILVPLVIYGQGQERNFDLLADLPDDMPSKAGFDLLSESFGAGEMQPLDVVLTDIPDARSPAGMAQVAGLTEELLADDGVADVRSLTLPAGIDEPELGEALRVEDQLELMLEMVDDLGGQAAGASALADVDLDEVVAGMDSLRAYLDELSAAFPDLADNRDFQAAQAAVDGLEGAMVEGQQRLLLSSQLAEATDGLAGASIQSMEIDAAGVDALEDAALQFSSLRDYLSGMAAAHPAVTELDGYGDALSALDSLEASFSGIQESLLVSTQLDMLASGIAEIALLMLDPAALADLSASPEQMDSLVVLGVYLDELIEAYPSLAKEPATQGALEHLAAVNSAVEEVMQLQTVSGQLALVAQQMQDSAQALEENPLSFMPQPGEPSAADQMSALVDYLEQLGSAYPALSATEDFQTAVAVTAEMGSGLETIDLSKVNELVAQTKDSLEILGAALGGLSITAAETLPGAVFVPEDLPDGMMALAPDLSPVVEEIVAAGEAFSALAQVVRQEMPGAVFVPETLLSMADSSAMAGTPTEMLGTGSEVTELTAAVTDSVDDLAAALDRLSAAAAVELSEATYIPPDDLMAGEADAVVESVMADIDAFQAALSSLAADFAGREDGFFVPVALAEADAAGEEITQLLDTYSTAGGDAARLQVVLAHDPFSPEAMDTVARIQDVVADASSGHVSGSTATNLDLREVMDRDFLRVVLLVIGGIFVVLIFLLRSLVAPIYMMATILLSYGATMGITRLVFDGLFGQGITWFVPFLIFILLVALGMDYNIFLMGRVKEEAAGHGTRVGIERAVERTGGIITSAGIIMAGTFAAMMSSPLLGLTQLAFAVAVGVLLDTFVIRTTLVPAIATLLGRWNWWPGQRPGKK